MPRPLVRSLATAAVGLAAFACSDSTDPRGPGSIYVNSSATLAEPGSTFFFYGISVDSGTPRMVSVFEDVSFIMHGMAQGRHHVEVRDLPSTCNAGANKRELSLRGNDTALVVFDIQCSRVSGDLRVVTTTTGPDPDDNGYIVTINGFDVASVAPTGSVTIPFINPGTYSIALGGVASNCSYPGAQSGTITAGALTTLNFAVTCVQSATIRLNATASGPDPDPDGVLLKVGSGVTTRYPVGTTYVRVPTGSQTWQLTDIQPNCTIPGATSGTLNLAAGDTVTIDATATCTDVGYGVAGTVASDAAADTLANTSNANRAHDLVQVTTRYATDWLILVLRFVQPVGSVGLTTPAGLQGWIELDIDESTATGFSPAINSFGGSATQGVDYGVILFEGSATSVRIERALANPDTTTFRVPMALEGDSVVIKIPLATLAADDGRMSVTMVLGTSDRPTDIAPNTGVILARPAAALRGNEAVAGARATLRAGSQPPKRELRWGQPRVTPAAPSIMSLRGTSPRTAPPSP